MYVLALIAAVALQAWTWQRLTGLLRTRTITKPRAALRYAAWAFLPVVCVVGGFAVMIGVEEWWGVALIAERAPLLVIPVFGIGVVGTVAFVVRSLCLRAPQTRT